MNIFEVLFYQPIYNLMVVFYHLLGDNLGLSIIAIGIISRVVMIPVTLKQQKMNESTKLLSEKTKAIKEKYKNDKEKQKEEILKVNQEHMPAVLGGCLPLIFQLILFVNVYNVVRNIISTKGMGFNNVAYDFVNKFPENFNIKFDFLNIFNLGDAASLHKAFPDALPYVILIILVGLTQYFSLKLVTQVREQEASKKKEEELKVSNRKDKKKKKQQKVEEKAPEDFSEIMKRSTKQTMIMMPFLLMVISYGLPSGLSLYLITTSTFVILQQVIYYELRKRKDLKNKDLNLKS